MRLAIIADIHGNYRALQAVLADIAGSGAQRIISLGDNIGYGPEPEEVVRALLEHEAVSVMGNHELALVSRSYFGRLNPTAQSSLILTGSLLSAGALEWLAGLPPFHVERQTRFVHGCPPQSATVYLHAPTDTRLVRLFDSYPERLCFAGHTHDFGCYQLHAGKILRHDLRPGPGTLDPHDRYLLLPGSVGQPRDSLSWHAKYLLVDQEAAMIEVRTVAYDVQATMRLLAERGFPAVNAQRLVW